MVNKESFHRIELLLAVSAVVVLFGIFFINIFDFSLVLNSRDGNILTGFVSSDVVTQNLNIESDESYTYDLSTTDYFTMTSLRLTGEIEGLGAVRMYLEDDSGRTLIYSNVRKKQAGNIITGAAVGVEPSGSGESIGNDLEEGEEFVTGPFYNVCSESCFISSDFGPDKKNKLVFELGEGVDLKVSQMAYTTLTE